MARRAAAPPPGSPPRHRGTGATDISSSSPTPHRRSRSTPSPPRSCSWPPQARGAGPGREAGG